MVGTRQPGMWTSQPGMWECHEDKNGYVYSVAEDDKEILESNSRNWKDRGKNRGSGFLAQPIISLK